MQTNEVGLFSKRGNVLFIVMVEEYIIEAVLGRKSKLPLFVLERPWRGKRDVLIFLANHVSERYL